jgi:hypothetical protein
VTLPQPSPTLRALLRRVVDYAGLFPPAALEMPEAVEQYAAQLRSGDAWMLGRFVVPVERLDELARVAGPSFGEAAEPWRLSALIGTRVADAGPAIRSFNNANRGRFLVDVVECHPLQSGSVARAVGALPGELRIFVELPLVDDPRPMLQEISAAGAWAKMRTGGVTPDAFPATRQVVRLIARAAEVRVPFKATAGLHHPICGEYPMSYEEHALRGRMFGFLNLFAAAVFAQQGVRESLLAELLEERDPGAIAFGEDRMQWRGCWASAKQIVSARSSLAMSFGSCSFAEPVAGLRDAGLL